MVEDAIDDVECVEAAHRDRFDVDDGVQELRLGKRDLPDTNTPILHTFQAWY